MNRLDRDYQQLLQDIIEFGVDKMDRTGTGCRSLFGYTIRHNMRNGFPLLTTKKMFFKGIVTELLWFLRGDTNIKYLVDNDCHIWDGDAYMNYLNNSRPNENDKDFHETRILISKEDFINKIKTDDEFAKKWGELGPVYGRMWRAFDEDSYGGIDQIANLINDLKTNPDSRRLMVTAWHPGYNQHSVLPPCHYGFQVYTYEKEGKRHISLMWNQRSVDTFLGLPFNIASYGLLLEIIASEVNMVPDQLIGNLGDVHLYNNHIEQAKEQIDREPYELPQLKVLSSNILEGDFEVEINNYTFHPTIKAPLSN